MLIDQYIREPERLRQEADLSDQEYRRGIESWSKQQPALPGTRDENRLPMAEEQRELSPTQQSSWGPESEQLTKQPTIQQGLENIISASRTARQKMADAARYQTGLEHIDIPGTGITAGQAAATAVNIINPLPSSKTDVALAAIPFATVMKGVRAHADDMARWFTDVEIGKYTEAMEGVVRPRIMRLVTEANKEGLEHMDPLNIARWIDGYMARGVKDLTGRVHFGKPGELHEEIARRMAKQGVKFADDIADSKVWQLGGGEIVNDEIGQHMDLASSVLYEEAMKRHGR
jgi:hypothetical protein